MRIAFFFLALVVVGSCTILRSDPESKVGEFLQTFQNEIKKPAGNTDILTFFETDQTRESILSAIEVLRNSEFPRVACIAAFDQSTTINDSLGLRVVVPVVFDVDTLTVSNPQETSFTIWLKESKNELAVTRLDAEEFYRTYTILKGEVAWILEEQDILDRHKKYFRVSKQLREMYDSVIWVVEYKGNDYYYVTNGPWSLKDVGNQENQMGVVDSLGRIIVPIEYQVVGNPGVLGEDIVEIQGPNTGTFDIIKRRVVIEPQYSWVIPYESGSAKALVMSDSIGWINDRLKFVPGFPDKEARDFYLAFGYVPENYSISYETQSLLEHPHESNFGDGTFITPKYLQGVFPPYYENLTLDGSVYRAWIGSVEGGKSLLETVTSTFSAFVTSITSHYIEGRQDFYTTKKLNFVTEDGSVLDEIELASGDVTLRKIDSTLLEVKSVYEMDPMDYMGEGTGFVENIPSYDYFSISEEGPSRMTSNRRYDFTYFVRLDSSYFEGNFIAVDEQGNVEELQFLNEQTINDIRADILADYQFQIDDPLIKIRISERAGYSPIYTQFSDISPNLSEIDRYNLNFLAKILGPLPGQNPL